MEATQWTCGPSARTFNEWTIKDGTDRFIATARDEEAAHLIVADHNAASAYRELQEAAEAVDEWYGYEYGMEPIADERYDVLMAQYETGIAWRLGVGRRLRAALASVKGEANG